MKKIFIIPGFKQKTNNKSFAWLKGFLKEKGFEVLMVPITWDRRTIREYVQEFETFYFKHKGLNNYVLGFSYGAVIAFVSGQKLKPKKLYLCSLSSDSKEDLPKMKRWIVRYLGKRRIAEIATRSGVKIAKKLSIPTVVIYGEEEGKQYPALKYRCEQTARLAKHAKLFVAPSAPHDISHPEYIKTLRTVFG